MGKFRKFSKSIDHNNQVNKPIEALLLFALFYSLHEILHHGINQIYSLSDLLDLEEVG